MIDLIIIGVVLILLFFGIYKGFFREIFEIVSLVGGIYLGFNLMDLLLSAIRMLWPNGPGWLLPALSFVLIFVTVVMLSRLLANALTKLFSWAMLGWLNRLGGALVGAAKGLLLASLLLLALRLFASLSTSLQESLAESELAEYILPIAPGVFQAITGLLPATSEELEEFIPEFDLDDLPLHETSRWFHSSA
jgi:membrane protein required for colicin V production